MAHPGAAARTEGHGATGVQYGGTAATVAWIEAFRYAQFEFVAATYVAWITE